MFENRVLRRIFGPKRNEPTDKWGKLHNEELNDLFCSPNIVRVIKSRIITWAGHVARMWRGGTNTEFWGGERERERETDTPEGKRPLVKPRRRW